MSNKSFKRVEIDIRDAHDDPITNIRFADSRVTLRRRGLIGTNVDCGTISILSTGQLSIYCPHVADKSVLITTREDTLNLIEALKKALTLPNIFNPSKPSVKPTVKPTVKHFEEESESEAESDNDM